MSQVAEGEEVLVKCQKVSRVGWPLNPIKIEFRNQSNS
jgi:hypothetical protein